jgi:long-chain acyl-CoA synthetase
LVARPTVGHILADLAAGDASRPVLTYYRAGVRESTWTAELLLTAVKAVQLRLRNDMGVGPGDRVIVQSANRPEFIVASLAVMAMRAIVVPMSADESADRACYVVEHCHAAALLTDQGATVGGLQVRDVREMSDVAGFQPDLGEWDVRTPHETPAVLLYTSGTTGRPKGVCLNHHNLTVNAEALTRTHSLRHDSTHVCVLPLHHANAFGFSMIATLYAGGRLVLNDSFPFFGIADVINAEQADTISLIPQIIRSWSRLRVHASDVPSLRYVVSAAAPLSVDLAREFYTTTGLRIHQGYGLSECTNFATTIPDGLSDDRYAAVMYGQVVPSIGIELFGVRCDTVNSAGEVLPEGVEGEITVQGQSVMRGYWQDDAATAAAVSECRLRTGDLGFWRWYGDERYFFVTGRIKELIIRAGVNVSPREVEDELNVPGDWAVVGFAHEVVGEEVGVYVKGPLSATQRDSLLVRVAELPASRRPRVVLCGRRAVPRTPTGKVRRRELSRCFEPYRNSGMTEDPLFVDVGAE